MAALPPDRFAKPAGWILAALVRGPSGAAAIHVAIRAGGLRVGPGSLIAALARLERVGLVQRFASEGRPMYRLASQSLERYGWIEG